MAPPVRRESFTIALGNVRQLLTTARDTQDPKEVLVKAFQAIEATAEAAEEVIVTIPSIAQTIWVER